MTSQYVQRSDAKVQASALMTLSHALARQVSDPQAAINKKHIRCVRKFPTNDEYPPIIQS